MRTFLVLFLAFPISSFGQIELPNQSLQRIGVTSNLDSLLPKESSIQFSSVGNEFKYFKTTHPFRDFFCVWVAGKWIVYNYGVSSIDTAYTQDLNGGLPELVVESSPMNGMSGEHAGWSSTETRLIVIDMEQDYVLLNIATRYSQDNWDERGRYFYSDCTVKITLRGVQLRVSLVEDSSWTRDSIENELSGMCPEPGDYRLEGQRFVKTID